MARTADAVASAAVAAGEGRWRGWRMPLARRAKGPLARRNGEGFHFAAPEGRSRRREAVLARRASGIRQKQEEPGAKLRTGLFLFSKISP